MYSKIVVAMALDHDLSPQTLAVAKSLLAPGGEIIALHVHEAASGSVGAYLDEAVVRSGYEKAEALLKEKISGADGVRPVLVAGHAARSIIDFADENGVDCIVLGSHKPGLIDYFLGSTAARVVRHAGCAVHVQRHRT